MSHQKTHNKHRLHHHHHTHTHHRHSRPVLGLPQLPGIKPQANKQYKKLTAPEFVILDEEAEEIKAIETPIRVKLEDEEENSDEDHKNAHSKRKPAKTKVKQEHKQKKQKTSESSSSSSSSSQSAIPQDLSDHAHYDNLESGEYEVESIEESIKISLANKMKNFILDQEISEETKMRHQEQSEINPYESTEFKSLLEDLGFEYEKYSHDVSTLNRSEYTQEMLEAELKKPRVNLPLRSSYLEDLLLGSFGRYWIPELNRFVFFPSCKRGYNCIAYRYHNNIRGLTKPTILMGSMNGEQFKALMAREAPLDEEAEETEEARAKREPCVLCYRSITAQLITIHKKQLMKMQEDLILLRMSNQGYDRVSLLPIQTYMNSIDKPNGYHHAYISAPFNPRDQLIYQPIATGSLQGYLGVTNPISQRIFINQDRLKYAHKEKELFKKEQDWIKNQPSSDKPSNVSVFLQSNKQVLQNVDKKSNKNPIRDQIFRQQTITYYETILASLLLDPENSYILSTSESTGEIMINLSHCHQIVILSNTDSFLKLLCLELLDAWILSGDNTGASLDNPPEFISWNTLVYSGALSKICSGYTLNPVLINKFSTLAWFSPLTDIHNALSRILAKTGINVRCQLRTSWKIIRDLLVTRTETGTKRKEIQYNDETLQIMKQIVLCALLGSYEGILGEYRRPCSLHVRSQLYMLFSSTRYDSWIVQMFEHVSSLLKLCVRVCMLWYLEREPLVLQELRDMIHYDEFRIICIQAIGRVRECFSEWLSGPSSSSLFDECLRSQDLNVSAQRLFTCRHTSCHNLGGGWCRLYQVAEKDTILQAPQSSLTKRPAHSFHLLFKRILTPYDVLFGRCGFRRPYSHIIHLCRPVLKEFPLIPLRDSVSSSRSSPERSSESQDDPSSMVTSYTDLEQEQDDAEEKLNKQDTYLFPKYRVSDYLLPTQQQALHQVINSCGPVTYSSPVSRIIPFLPFFGISHEHTEYIQDLFKRYLDQSLSVQFILRSLWNLRILDPHAYNLIQLTSQFLEQANRRFYLCDLPVHILRNQLEVLIHSFEETKGTGRLLDQQLSLVFCIVCYRVYSPIYDPASHHHHHHGHHGHNNTLHQGLLDVHYSYTEHEAHCMKKMYVEERGRCSGKNLVRIPMLGRVLWLRLKCIMICPQVGCGRLFTFDTTETAGLETKWNERGPMCCRCATVTQEKESKSLIKLWIPYAKAYKAQLQDPYLRYRFGCYYCAKIEKEFSKIYYYAFHPILEYSCDLLKSILEQRGATKAAQEQEQEVFLCHACHMFLSKQTDYHTVYQERGIEFSDTMRIKGLLDEYHPEHPVIKEERVAPAMKIEEWRWDADGVSAAAMAANESMRGF